MTVEPSAEPQAPPDVPVDAPQPALPTPPSGAPAPGAPAPGAAPGSATPTGSGRPSRSALVLLGAAGSVVLLLGLGLAYGTTRGDVPRGVRVAGVDVGGLSRDQAEQELRRTLDPVAAGPLRLLADGEELLLQPAAAGLGIDVDATLDQAMAGGALERLRASFGSERELPAVTSVDEDRLRASLRTAARSVDRTAREGRVGYRGTGAVPVLPRTGRVLQVDEAVDDVRRAWPTTGPVEVDVARQPTRSAAADVQAVALGAATAAVAGPVVLDADGRRLEVPARAIARTLTFRPGADGRLVPRLDAPALRRALRDDLREVETRPRDARIEIRDRRPRVVPGRDGAVVTTAALQQALMPVLERPAGRTAPLSLTRDEPDLTTAEARDLGVVERIGTFTTRHPCCRPRVRNIHTIADLVDGTLVMPGETYSLNGAVGPRDRARGFVSAPQILDGQFVDRVGGGVSQFATTMYNAVFFAGLEDVEHRPHSYYITRYPEGREATVSTPAPDLKWRNDSPNGVLVTTSYTGRSITVTLWGTKQYDRVRSVSSGRSNIRSFGTEYVTRSDCTASAGHVGFDIRITRLMERDGRVVKRDSSSHRYLPEPRFICAPPPGARGGERSGSGGGSDAREG